MTLIWTPLPSTLAKKILGRGCLNSCIQFGTIWALVRSQAFNIHEQFTILRIPSNLSQRHSLMFYELSSMQWYLEFILLNLKLNYYFIEPPLLIWHLWVENSNKSPRVTPLSVVAGVFVIDWRVFFLRKTTGRLSILCRLSIHQLSGHDLSLKYFLTRPAFSCYHPC